MYRDYEPYLKSLDNLRQMVKKNGEIVNIDVRYYANDIDVSEKTYTHENGLKLTLDAVRAGVDSL